MNYICARWRHPFVVRAKVKHFHQASFAVAVAVHLPSSSLLANQPSVASLLLCVFS